MWRAAVAVVVSCALSGCAGGPTFAELFDDSAAGEGTGFQGAALVRAVVILARHQATPRQRAVAQQNAERAIARMERELAVQSKAPAPKPKPKPRVAQKTAPAPKKPTASGAAPRSKAKPEPAPEPPAEEPAPKVAKPAVKKKLPARIAVRTVKEANTAPQAEAAVMIYDVRARRIVGNEVYDIEQEPPPGETVKFDTSVVRYVGATSY